MPYKNMQQAVYKWQQNGYSSKKSKENAGKIFKILCFIFFFVCFLLFNSRFRFPCSRCPTLARPLQFQFFNICRQNFPNVRVLRKKTSSSKGPPAWIKNQQKQNRKNEAQLNLLFQNFPSVCTSYALSRYALSSVCRLDYPITLINYTINMFIQNITTKPEGKTDDGNTIRIVLLFKDQIAANAVCRRLRDRSNKIAVTFQPLSCEQKIRSQKSALRCLQICTWCVWSRLF